MDIATAVLPTHDFQTSADLDLTETDLLLQCFEDVDLSLFSFDEDQNALVPSSYNQQYDPANSLNDSNHGDLVVCEEDPLNDPYVWALCNGEDNDHVDDINNNDSNNLLESLCGVEESSGHGINGDNNYEVEYAMHLVPQSRYNCSLCHKLRQITHTNGSTSKVKRLEIHGIIGIITHAVVETYDLFDSCFQIRESKLFDFHRENSQVVKGFLRKYLKDCEEEGYTSMIHEDPLTTFYEAMCVGLSDHCHDDAINSNPDHDFQQFPQGNNNSQDDYQNGAYNQTGGFVIRSSSLIGSRSKRTSLSVQRERTKRLRMQDLMEYFDIRMEQAAKKLNVCPTVVKKLCRRNGIERWPFRKVRSLKKNIAKKTELLNSSSGEEVKKRLQADILIMEQELAQIYETIY